MNVAPGSVAGDAGYRALLLIASARLGHTEAETAVATALRTTALGRVPAEEHAWLDRIAAHREKLASGAIAESAARDPRELDAQTRNAEAADACLWMSLPPLLGSLLMRLVRELAPQSCLELGTGFGVSASYQAAALDLNGSGSLISLDVEDMVRIARPALADIGLGERTELRGGMIEQTLTGAVTDAAPLDFALLDADHTERGTLAAFEALLPAVGEGGVLVFDDINWTGEMRRAWHAVRAHPRVRNTVAVRRLGLAIIAGDGAGP